MRYIFLGFILLLSVSFSTHSVATEDTSKESDKSLVEDYSVANKRYLELVDKVKGSINFDYVKALKLTYVNSEFYQPFLGAEQELSIKLLAEIASKQWQDCLQTSQQILASNYISLNAHYGAMACSFETKAEKQGKFHRSMINNLLEVMWQSGDGQSPATAFFCTSITELKSFLKFAGLKINKQSIMKHEGKSYDLVAVTDPDSGNEFNLFFDMSSQWTFGFKGIN